MNSRWMAVFMAGWMVVSGTARAGGQAGEGLPAGSPGGASGEGTPAARASTEGKAVDPAIVAADALVVRPAGLAATVVGAAIYVVALPFAAIAGDVKGAGRALVGAPASFTFRRKLGDFDTLVE